MGLPVETWRYLPQLVPFEKENTAVKRLILFCALALGVAAPAQAGEWKELRVRGVVVSATAETIVVENAAGDAMLKCLVPERLAAKAAMFKPGDQVRMICARKRGHRAVLVRLARPTEKSERSREKGEKREHEGGDRGEYREKGEHLEKGESQEKAEKRAAATVRGVVVELAEAAIVVEEALSGRRLACRVAAAKAHKLEGVKLGDRVEIHCANNELAYLKRSALEETKRPAVEDSKLYGTITALSSTSVTVTGDGRTLTCSVPAPLAEKLGRFAVGNTVKMMCRGGDLSFLEKV
jgi:hypothetical protein